ncbi:MAG TPA: hypothetical protein VLA13_00435, partial [Massilibacterium sp.]|nr:hypothetical protein [Massilibacterium sp.]
EIERQLDEQFGIGTVVNNYVDDQVEVSVLYEDDFFELADDRTIYRDKNDVYSYLYFYIDDIKVKYIFDLEESK